MKQIKSLLLSVCLLTTTLVHAEEGSPLLFQDTWANWEKRLDRAYEGVVAQKMPGRCVGVIVPNDSREDLLPLSAISYETLAEDRARTVVFFIQAPRDYKIDGLSVPAIDAIDIPIGHFPIDLGLRALLQNGTWPVSTDTSLFMTDVPRIMQNQLANLKYVLKGKTSTLQVLPIYVKLTDPASQVKDYAPYLAELLKDADLDRELSFVVVANLSRSLVIDDLIKRDATLLSSFRSQDVEPLLAPDEAGVLQPDLDALALGLLTLRILASDHVQIMAYAHSAQLVLSKDKNSSISYISAAFASAPSIKARTPHVDREKMVTIFDELTRSDILALTRQTCASILDPTAAKPPSLTTQQAGKKWPAYVSLYTAEGNLAGQAGTHVPIGPLEETLRKFSLDAVHQAQPALTKTNFNSYVVDVSIPYGFEGIHNPDELVPILNGVIVHQKLKTSAYHPDAWRKYPDPHQLLSSICVRLGLKPWAYATGQANLESFRILSFNEKEPFQDLGAATRKKKKKKGGDATDDLGDDGTGDSSGGGGGGGGSPFGGF